MRRNRATYWKVALAAVFINIFGLLTALFTMTVYDRVVPNNAMASLVALSIGLGIVIIFDFILKMLRAYFVDHAGAHIDRDIGEAVFDRLLAMRLELKKGSTGALAGMMRELEALRDFFASATLTAVVDVPFILLTLLIVAIIGGWVVLVPALMVPLVILVGWLTHPALERLSARAMGEGLQKQSVLVEAIGGLETVKSAGAAPLLTRRWSKAVEQHSDSSLRQRLVAAIGVTFATSAGHHLLCRRRHRRRQHDRRARADHGRPHRLLDPGRPRDRAAGADLAAALAHHLDPHRLPADQRDDGNAARKGRPARR